MEDWENTALRGFLVLATAPAWVPFMRALWEELNEAMADEGGLFGRIPTNLELEEITREKRRRPAPLIHAPWPTPGQRMQGRRTMGLTDKDKGPGNPNAPPKLRGPTRRRGF